MWSEVIVVLSAVSAVLGVADKIFSLSGRISRPTYKKKSDN
jgi:hypothetical protein